MGEKDQVASTEKRRVPFQKGLFQVPGPGAEEFRLLASRCQFCQTAFFPKRAICQNCAREDGMEVILLSPKGKLYSFTSVEYDRGAPPGFQVPYLIGSIEMPEGVRVLSMLKDCEFADLKFGLEMEALFEKIRENREGDEVMAFRFKPVRGKS